MRHLVTTLLLLSAAACGGGKKSPETAARPARAIVPIDAQITNNTTFDAHVYVVRPGDRRTLGIVQSGRTVTVQIPGEMIVNNNGIQLFVLLIGSGQSFTTDKQMAFPGEVYQLNILPTLRASTFTVFRPE